MVLAEVRGRLRAVSGLAEKGLLEGKSVTYLSPRLYLAARVTPELIREFDYLRVGSWIVVQVLRITGIASVKRESFDLSSLAPMILASAEEDGRSIFCIGGKTSEVEAAVAKLRDGYPKLKLAGYSAGYFDTPEELEHMAGKIAAVRPNMVLVGMGPVLQEQFAMALREAGYKGTIHTCGAFITQLAEERARYHPLMDRLELRWVQRLSANWHIMGRLLITYPRFIATILWDVYWWRRMRR